MISLKFTPLCLLLVSISLVNQAICQEQLSTFIKTKDGDSHLGQIAIFKNEIYFPGTSAEHGTELWKTDGTAEGTKLVKDIAIGASSSLLIPADKNPTIMGDYLYFWANDGNSGEQIWRTDGTPQNTIRITEHPGKNKSQIISTGNQLFYFTSTYEDTNHSDNTVHLWVSDGSPFSERLLEETFPVSSANTIRFMMAFDSIVYFANNNFKTQIWQSDGTVEGTFPVTNEIGEESPLRDAKLPIALSFFQNEAYFWSKSPDLISQSFGFGLFKIDRTTNSIQLVKSFNAGDLGQAGVSWQVLNDHIYYLLYDDTNKRQQLIISDGTPAGTSVLKRSQGFNNFTASNLIAIGKKLYYTSANADPENTTSLYEYDTETGGEKELASFNTPFYRFFDPDWSNIKLSTNQQHIFIDKLPLSGNKEENFFIYDLAHAKLETSNVTSYGRLTGTVYKGTYFFLGIDETKALGRELYKIDTTTKESILIKNINTSSHNGVDHLLPYSNGNQLLLSVTDSTLRAATFDGTDKQFSYFPELRLEEETNRYAQLGEKVIFSYNDQNARRELGILENNEFKLLADIVPGSGSGQVNFLTPLQNKVYFMANSNGDSFSDLLYTTDGTSSGTQPVITLTNPIEFKAIKRTENFLYLMTTNAGDKVYRYDPMTNDTMQFGQFFRIREFLPVSDKLVVQAQTVNYGSKEIYVADGLQPPIRFPIDDRIEESSIVLHISMGDQFYFTAYAQELGYELWVGDLTTNTTQLLKDINPGSLSSNRITRFAKGRNELYFTATDEDHGVELWKTDGTPGGTALVKDINEGLESSNPTSLYFAPNNKLYFTAFTEETGTELWVSEGTTATTKRLSDIVSGTNNSNPAQFYMSDSILYFVALDAQDAYQLYQLDKDDTVSSLPNQHAELEVKIYPNPSSHFISVDLSDAIELPVLFNLYDLNGALISSSQVDHRNFQMNVSHLDLRVYVLTITSPQMTISKRVLIGQ